MNSANLKDKKRVPWWLGSEESACQCRRHRFNLWSGKIPQAEEQLSLRATAIEPVLYSPPTAATETCAPRAHALQWEKPPPREAGALQPGRPSHLLQLEWSQHSKQRPSTARRKETTGCESHPVCSGSAQLSLSVVSSSLQPQGLQHTRLPCPSAAPRACSDARPSSQWCHPTRFSGWNLSSLIGRLKC